MERRLHRGGRGNADVLLVRHAGKQFVVKDFAPRAWLLRSTFGRWSIGREWRAYRALDGIDAVPRLLGLVDPLALAIEYRPGSLLSRSLAGVLPADFLGELRGAVAAMHARGVVHLDLRHRSNILATPEGHPVLIDFASSAEYDVRDGNCRVRPLERGDADDGSQVSGRTLLAMAARRFDDERVAAEAKGVLRRVIRYHLGGKPLNTRRILQDLKQL